MWSFQRINRLSGLSAIRPEPSREITGFSIDTRSLRPGNFFIALRGSRFDGAVFVPEAFKKGASGAVVCEVDIEKISSILQANAWQNLYSVPDPLVFLQNLAAAHLVSYADMKRVVVTGSVGKTSTKDFLSYVLSGSFHVCKTQGNFNNHIGLPLTLLSMADRDKVLVAELGASGLGEIRKMVSWVKPQLVVLTPIGSAHLKGFGSLQNVYKAKLESLEAEPKPIKALLPDSDELLIQGVRDRGVDFATVGFSDKADYRIRVEELADTLFALKVNRMSFRVPMPSALFALNAALAVSAACELGLRPDDLPETWRGLEFARGRFQREEIGGVKFVNDAYNANPLSFSAALNSFAASAIGKRKGIIFSDMLELGSDEVVEHQMLGKKIAQAGFDYAIAFGSLAHIALDVLGSEKETCEVIAAEGPEDCAEKLKAQVKQGDFLLFKGSRAMNLDFVINEIRQFLKKKDGI